MSDYSRISRAQKEYVCEACKQAIPEGTFYINTGDLRWGFSARSGRKFVSGSTKGQFHVGCRLKSVGSCKLCALPVFKSFDHHPMESYVLHTECYDVVFIGGDSWKMSEEMKEKFVNETTESKNAVERARRQVLARPDYKKLVDIGFLQVLAQGAAPTGSPQAAATTATPAS
jgi:phage pi2 protein 07